MSTWCMETQFLHDLNPAQRRAVLHEHGPLLIIAGAGTGKTTVITRHIAWLIESGRATPEQILALTFTDKAAGEMTERIDSLLPLGYSDLWASTFHAFCERILQHHGLDIGLPHEFRLLGETDAYLLVRKNFDAFPLDYYRPLGNPTKCIYALLKHFSRAKDEAIHPREYLEYSTQLALQKDNPAFDHDDLSRQTELASAYHAYQKLLLDNGCLDLGDLLLYTIELFRKRPAILRMYQQQFHHVIVDEFQDTNWAQYALLKMLVAGTKNIVVVGDDDQSIYKFRGASVSNILQFKDDFPETKEIVLTENYRSYQNILDLSYAFIQQNNPNRLEAKLAGQKTDDGVMITKKMSAIRGAGADIRHLHYRSIEDEASGVVDTITTLKKAGAEWSDFCILVRSNSSASEFSYELQRRGVPYQFLALKGLYTKPIILDSMAYFTVLQNYHESSSLYRMLSSPVYAIPIHDLVTLTHEAQKYAQSLYTVITHHALIVSLAPETHHTIERLRHDIETHAGMARSKPVSELLVQFLFDSGYMNILKKDDATAQHRDALSYLQQFLSHIKRFENNHDQPLLKYFLEEFTLERESGEEGGLAFDVDTGPDMVRIMTVHAAKGLEFRYVFIVNMVDKRFPSVSRGGDIPVPDALTKEILPDGDIHLEEERRLFYVAMTRAKDGLFFTSSEDHGGKTKKKISRFLTELGFTTPLIAPTLEQLRAPVVQMQEEKITTTPPTYFSFTQLAAYAKCPLQYKFAHVLHIPVFGKPQFSFGKTMHETLEKFLRIFVERRANQQSSLFDHATVATLPTKDELFSLYEENWHDEWYSDAVIKKKFYDHGKNLLDRFYTHISAHPPDVLLIEKDFRLKLGDFILKGKIDRIDRVTDHDIEIIDYKTGSPKEEKTISSEEKKQLILYFMAASRVLGKNPVKLTYHYLEDGSLVSFLPSALELEKYEGQLLDQMHEISKGDFPPKPGNHCKTCDFAKICEFRQ